MLVGEDFIKNIKEELHDSENDSEELFNRLYSHKLVDSKIIPRLNFMQEHELFDKIKCRSKNKSIQKVIIEFKCGDNLFKFMSIRLLLDKTIKKL